MSQGNPPKDPNSNPEQISDEQNQELISETFPILQKIHARLADELPKTMEGRNLDDQVKLVFDGAIYAHDHVRTQDWPKLRIQLEEIATDTIVSLVLLQRRHERSA
jgi:hypothetical protein